MIAILEKTGKGFETADKRWHDERAFLNVQLEASGLLAVESSGTAFAQQFHFLFADGVGNPLGRLGLVGAQVNLGGWLRKHDLCGNTIVLLDLTAAMEPHDHSAV